MTATNICSNFGSFRCSPPPPPFQLIKFQTIFYPPLQSFYCRTHSNIKAEDYTSLFPSHIHRSTHSHILPLSHTHLLTHTTSLSHTHTYTLSLSSTYSLYILSLTYTHTYSLSHTHSPSHKQNHFLNKPAVSISCAVFTKGFNVTN